MEQTNERLTLPDGSTIPVSPENRAHARQLWTDDNTSVSSKSPPNVLVGTHVLSESPSDSPESSRDSRGGGKRRVCVSCGDSGSAMKTCARCRECWYCSRTCQKNHWHVHKNSCRGAVGTDVTRKHSEALEEISAGMVVMVPSVPSSPITPLHDHAHNQTEGEDVEAPRCPSNAGDALAMVRRMQTSGEFRGLGDPCCGGSTDEDADEDDEDVGIKPSKELIRTLHDALKRRRDQTETVIDDSNIIRHLNAVQQELRSGQITSLEATVDACSEYLDSDGTMNQLPKALRRLLPKHAAKEAKHCLSKIVNHLMDDKHSTCKHSLILQGDHSTKKYKEFCKHIVDQFATVLSPAECGFLASDRDMPARDAMELVSAVQLEQMRAVLRRAVDEHMKQSGAAARIEVRNSVGSATATPPQQQQASADREHHPSSSNEKQHRHKKSSVPRRKKRSNAAAQTDQEGCYIEFSPLNRLDHPVALVPEVLPHELWNELQELGYGTAERTKRSRRAVELFKAGPASATPDETCLSYLHAKTTKRQCVVPAGCPTSHADKHMATTHDNTRQIGTIDTTELVENDAVIVLWDDQRHYDAVVLKLDAARKSIHVQFEHGHQSSWVDEACVQRCEATATSPDGFEIGKLIEAQDPHSDSPTTWHLAKVASAHVACNERLRYWVEYEPGQFGQWCWVENIRRIETRPCGNSHARGERCAFNYDLF